jgi:hypothetical protein
VETEEVGIILQQEEKYMKTINIKMDNSISSTILLFIIWKGHKIIIIREITIIPTLIKKYVYMNYAKSFHKNNIKKEKGKEVK